MVLKNPISELQVQVATLEHIIGYMIDELKIDTAKYCQQYKEEQRKSSFWSPTEAKHSTVQKEPKFKSIGTQTM